MNDRKSGRPSPRKRAMDCLARREHSVAELRTKLAAREYEPDEIEATLEQLAREGLASDERFAEAYTSACKRKGQGPLRIRAQLEQRGVDAELIAGCLGRNDGDWLELARAVRDKKFGGRPAGDFKERARQMRFLQYRGFTGDQITAAMGGERD